MIKQGGEFKISTIKMSTANEPGVLLVIEKGDMRLALTLDFWSVEYNDGEITKGYPGYLGNPGPINQDIAAKFLKHAFNWTLNGKEE